MAPKAVKRQKRRVSNRFEELTDENTNLEENVLIGNGALRSNVLEGPASLLINAESVLEAANQQDDLSENGVRNGALRENGPSTSSNQDQSPFNIDEFITAISERIDNKISESVRSVALETNETIDRAISSLRSEFDRRPELNRSRSSVIDDREQNHVSAWGEYGDEDRPGYMAANVPLCAPSDLAEGRRAPYPSDGRCRLDTNLDDTVVVESSSSKFQFDDVHIKT